MTTYAVPVDLQKRMIDKLEQARDAFPKESALYRTMQSVISDYESEQEDQAALSRYRDAAIENSEDGVCEVQDDACVSDGEEPGAYVQAWVWVSDLDTQE